MTADLKADARDETGLTGRTLGDCPESGALLEKDERLLAELPYGDGLKRSQAVRGGQRRQHRLADERENLKSGGLLNVERGDREVDLAVCGHGEHVAGGVLAQRYVDTGMGGVKRGQQPGEVQPGQRLHRADNQPPAGEALERGDLRPGGIDLREGAASPGEEHLPRLGQVYPAARAFEKLDAEFLLKQPDLMRKGRLGHWDGRRRPGEVAVVGDRDGVAQLSKFHTDSRSKLAGLCLGQLIASAGSWA